jgi:hypothetical protein
MSPALGLASCNGRIARAGHLPRQVHRGCGASASDHWNPPRGIAAPALATNSTSGSWIRAGVFASNPDFGNGAGASPTPASAAGNAFQWQKIIAEAGSTRSNAALAGLEDGRRPGRMATRRGKPRNMGAPDAARTAPTPLVAPIRACSRLADPGHTSPKYVAEQS